MSKEDNSLSSSSSTTKAPSSPLTPCKRTLLDIDAEIDHVDEQILGIDAVKNLKMSMGSFDSPKKWVNFLNSPTRRERSNTIASLSPPKFDKPTSPNNKRKGNNSNSHSEHSSSSNVKKSHSLCK